jgi:hypothetical protein
MTISSLNPDNIIGPDRQLGRGHGIDALGPSDLSDTGSDSLGLNDWTDEMDLDGDDYFSDTDSSGTGERVGAGRYMLRMIGQDIDVDRIENFPQDGEEDPDGEI